MEFEITETEKYKSFVKNEQSLIELAKVEVLQKIAEQLETMNKKNDQSLIELAKVEVLKKIAEQLEALNKAV